MAPKLSAQKPATFFYVCARNSRKSDFLGKMLLTRWFSSGKFFGAVTQKIQTHSGFWKYSRFGWLSLRFEVTAAQSEVISKKRLCYKKSEYSEPSGRENSPGTTFYIPCLFKNLSKSRLSDWFFGLFLVISEVLNSENSDFQDLSVLGVCMP